MYKECVRCRRVKSINEYYIHKGFPDEHRNTCIFCMKNDYRVSVGKEPIEDTDQVYEVKKLPKLVKIEVFVPKEELTSFLIQMKKMSKKYVEPKMV